MCTKIGPPTDHFKHLFEGRVATRPSNRCLISSPLQGYGAPHGKRRRHGLRAPRRSYGRERADRPAAAHPRAPARLHGAARLPAEHARDRGGGRPDQLLERRAPAQGPRGEGLRPPRPQPAARPRGVPARDDGRPASRRLRRRVVLRRDRGRRRRTPRDVRADARPDRRRWPDPGRAEPRDSLPAPQGAGRRRRAVHARGVRRVDDRRRDLRRRLRGGASRADRRERRDRGRADRRRGHREDLPAQGRPRVAAAAQPVVRADRRHPRHGPGQGHRGPAPALTLVLTRRQDRLSFWPRRTQPSRLAIRLHGRVWTPRHSPQRHGDLMPNRRMLRRAPVLLAVVASTVALVATTLSTPAVAAAPSSRTGVTHSKKADQHWSRAKRAKHALARATKALAPETPANDRPDATLALRNLFLLKDALSPADRAAADKLSQRPNKPATIGDANILVHYDPAELNPAAYSVNQALSTLEYVADSYANSGYRRPKSDGTKGGDGRIDVYLDSLEPGLYGYCTTDQKKLTKPGHYDVWAYCVLDNDYAGFPAHTPLQNLEVTAAHEYYHATQFAYDIADDGWFLESTATWAEDELFPDVNDNLQYLRDSPITRPTRPMDKFGGVFHYGVWNFFRYLTEHYPAKTGALPGLLLKMWQYADSSKGPRKDLYSTQAINKALKKAGHTSLAEQFANYSAATRATHQTFAEGAALNYPTKPLAGGATLPKHKHKSFKAKLDHLTSSTYQFVPGGGTSKLKV